MRIILITFIILRYWEEMYWTFSFSRFYWHFLQKTHNTNSPTKYSCRHIKTQIIAYIYYLFLKWTLPLLLQALKLLRLPLPKHRGGIKRLRHLKLLVHTVEICSYITTSIQFKVPFHGMHSLMHRLSERRGFPVVSKPITAIN